MKRDENKVRKTRIRFEKVLGKGRENDWNRNEGCKTRDPVDRRGKGKK